MSDEVYTVAYRRFPGDPEPPEVTRLKDAFRTGEVGQWQGELGTLAAVAIPFRVVGVDEAIEWWRPEADDASPDRVGLMTVRFSLQRVS